MTETLSLISSDRYRRIVSGSASRFGAYILGKRYVSGEYNLFEYGRILDTEALASRATNRKINVTFRNGYSLVSKNEKLLKRIKKRIKEIEYVTDITFHAFLEQIVRTLYIYNNCYILITRSYKSSSSKGNKKPPIAGLSVLPVETIDVLLDPNGVILGYKQRVGSWKKEYSKDEILHLALDKRPGMILGTPPLEAVKDDIIALRKIEENVELLIDRSIFPLLHVKVGNEKNPAGMLEDGTSEITHISNEMANIDKTGGLVTNERVDIKAIGAESLALRVESYLNYFKSRVLMGLGVTALDLGESDSTGKTNSEVLSLNIIDTVEFYQAAIEDFFNKLFTMMIIDDSFYNFSHQIDDENMVKLEFNSGTQDKDIKLGSHYADLYNKGVVSINEAREKIKLSEVKKEQEKYFYHNRTATKEKKETKLAANIAMPKNQHTKKNDNFSIVKEFLILNKKDYATNKVIEKIKELDYGLNEEGLTEVSSRVIDILIKDIRLSHIDVIKSEVIKYIME